MSPLSAVQRTPVHIISGFLGVGKTTLLQRELARRAGQDGQAGERCAVLVNDFGEARIDRLLLGGGVQVSDIAGGCVCCTAPAGLVPALTAILEELRPDRLFIEPSGLARPQDIVDMLARSGLRDRVVMMPVLVLVDASQAEARAHPLMLEQAEAADIAVLSRCDLATEAQIGAAAAWVAGLYPPPLLTLQMAGGEIPAAAWAWPEGSGLRLTAPKAHAAPSTAGFVARSWIFPVEMEFSWDRLRALLFGAEGLERFKGLFRADTGWTRIEWAGGRLQAAATGHRSDSRADIILRSGEQGGGAQGLSDEARLDALSAALLACVREAAGPPAGAQLTLVDMEGFSLALSRAALLALPGQIPDVSVFVSGRSGAGVLFREVLALAPPAARYLVTASDGMATAPAPVSGVGDAILCHSLGGGELPAGQGGPFRLLVPKGGSNCANVKGVARIRLLE